MIKPLTTMLMQRYWRMTRALTMGVQGVVLDNAGQVVLVRMTYRDGWHFPGGGVEKNELAATALARELREEANVYIRGTPELFGLYGHFAAFPSDHIALFVVRDWEQPSLPEPNYEIAACQRFPVDALPEDATSGVRRRLAELIDGAPQSPDW